MLYEKGIIETDVILIWSRFSERTTFEILKSAINKIYNLALRIIFLMFLISKYSEFIRFLSDSVN